MNFMLCELWVVGDKGEKWLNSTFINSLLHTIARSLFRVKSHLLVVLIMLIFLFLFFLSVVFVGFFFFLKCEFCEFQGNRVKRRYFIYFIWKFVLQKFKGSHLSMTSRVSEGKFDKTETLF